MEESTLGTEEKLTLEDRFWLMVLRAGSMDPEQAFQVLINYLTIMNTYPHYFASSRPPTKVDLTFQQKVRQNSESRTKLNISRFRLRND